MTNQRLLMIFIKNEVKGKAKTRLAATIGEDQALSIYRELLDKTANVTSALSGVDKIVYYGQEIVKNDRWSADHFHKAVQYNGSLGERMIRAFEDNFNKGYRHICIIGSDCWDLDTGHLQEAFEALETSDYVIGPANDGGYYLLGMNSLLRTLFEAKEFSTDSVFSEAIKEMKNAGRSFRILPELIDIDTEEDLKKTSLYAKMLSNRQAE